MIINPYVFGGAVDSGALALSIYNKLANGEWFTMESATSPLVGSRNSKNATKIGTGATSAVAAKKGNGIDFTPDALYRVATSDLPFTPASNSVYAMAAWVNMDALTGTHVPFGINDATDSTGYKRSLQLLIGSSGQVNCRAGNQTTAAFTDATLPGETIVTGAMNFIQCQRTTTHVRVRVNGGAWSEASLGSNTCPITNQCLDVGGAYSSVSPANTHANSCNGKVDEAFFLQGNLTDAEWNYLYNSGNGKSFAELAADAGF